MFLKFISQKLLQSLNMRKVLFTLIFINLIVWLSLIPYGSKNEVYFFDIGQGDAAMIQLGWQTQVLVDTGPGIEIIYELAKVMPAHDTHIEFIFISHQHNDHVGGLEYVAKHYSIGTVFMNTCSGFVNDPTFDSVEDVRRFVSGDVLQSNEFSLLALWPPSNFCNLGSNNENDLSQILVYEAEHTRILFTGDAEFGVDATVVYDFALPNIDVLKVPHHGSRNAITNEFLEKTSPDRAIISVGENSFGHPAADVLQLLESHGVQIFRTDKNGTTRFDLSSK